MQAGLAQGGLVSPVWFSLYVNDMPVPSRHVELDYTAIIATSRKPALLVSYLEACLSVLERWLREWRIAINISKSKARLFVKPGWRVPKHRQVQLLGEPIQLVDTARNLGVILDTQMTWSPYILQVMKAKDWVCLALSYTGEAVSPSRTEFCYINRSFGP